MSEGSMVDPTGGAVKVLVERISDAVGGAFKPFQIKRVAKAEAEARIILKDADITCSALEARALQRVLHQEGRYQEAIEVIATNALPQLAPGAKPENIDTDWLTNFFDKAKLSSAEEMREAWSKILAGEANKPGSFSKRTVNLLASLDKGDALIFTQICAFVVQMRDGPWLLIFDPDADIYASRGGSFGNLLHLSNIGLISFSPHGGYVLKKAELGTSMTYFKSELSITTIPAEDRDLPIGKVAFTDVGAELFRVCSPERSPDFFKYLKELSLWKTRGFGVTEITN